jgi:Phage tail assembly chaperone protein, TAC
MGMRPKDFWNMTLVEWRAALGGFAERHGVRARGIEAMGVSELAALMRRFPDGNA